MTGGSAGPAPAEIHEVTAAVVRPLRAEVLRPGGDPRELIYPGDELPGAFHLAARQEGEVVGIVSLSPEARTDGDAPRQRGLPQPAYRLRGMATAPSIRGAGVGAQLLDAALRQVARRGGDRVWCNARTSAEGFYLRHGFQPLGETFELPGIGPHRVMERRIP